MECTTYMENIKYRGISIENGMAVITQTSGRTITYPAKAIKIISLPGHTSFRVLQIVRIF